MKTNIRPEDKHIGARIRQRRNILKLTQQDVAAQLGLSFQQLQKYETGYNRTSGSMLCKLGRALDVPPAYFFEGIDGAEPVLEVRSSEEAALLAHFRKSPAAAKKSILDVVELTAQATPETPAQICA